MVGIILITESDKIVIQLEIVKLGLPRKNKKGSLMKIGVMKLSK